MARYVLVVDDEKECLDLASISLRLFGNFEVYQASDGPTALSKAQELKPDIILLDYYLPDTTGGEIVTSIRNVPELSEIPIVVYSGSPRGSGHYRRHSDSGQATQSRKPLCGPP